MLQNKLYVIRHLDMSADRSGVMAEIELDPGHPVFAGHFPGNPVLPGVCTVQIIKEILEQAFQRSLRMTRAGTVKYLGFVNPVTMPVLNFQLQLKPGDTTVISCSAAITVARGGSVCSFKGEFVRE